MIKKGKVTEQYINTLNKTQRDRLTKFYLLLDTSILSIEQTLSLTETECKALAPPEIQLLITREKITLDFAKSLVEFQRKNLTTHYAMILSGLLSVDAVTKFTYCNNQNFGYTGIQQLLQDNKITWQIVKGLIFYEAQYLAKIQPLISADLLSIDEAFALIEDEKNLIPRTIAKLKSSLDDAPQKKHDRITSLVISGFITAEEIEKLSFEECYNLGLKSIQLLIKANKVSLPEIKKLPLQKGRANSLASVCSSVLTGACSIVEAMTLTFDERKHLDYHGIQQLVKYNQLTLQAAKKLENNESIKLTNQYQLILANLLTIEEAKVLTDNENECLSIFTPLILANVLSMEKAKTAIQPHTNRMADRLRRVTTLIINEINGLKEMTLTLFYLKWLHGNRHTLLQLPAEILTSIAQYTVNSLLIKASDAAILASKHWYFLEQQSANIHLNYQQTMSIFAAKKEPQRLLTQQKEMPPSTFRGPL